MRGNPKTHANLNSLPFAVNSRESTPDLPLHFLVKSDEPTSPILHQPKRTNIITTAHEQTTKVDLFLAGEESELGRMEDLFRSLDAQYNRKQVISLPRMLEPKRECGWRGFSQGGC